MQQYTPRELAILCPAGFARLESRGHWKPSKHLLYIDKILVAVEQGLIDRVIFSLPPRHGKTSLISTYFPAWYLCRNPDHNIILTSYADRFSATIGSKVRNAISAIGMPIFGRSIERAENAASDDWSMKGFKGGMLSKGVGGAITGRGANGIIIDDPIANAQEANSKTIRDKIYDWYGSTLLTRLMPHGWQIIVMTRWNEDDLVGRILQEGDRDKKWKYVKLPAIAPYSDGKIGRNEGDALWPEMWPIEKLMQIKNSPGMTSYWWNSLYQQTPSPDQGSIFRQSTFRYFERHEAFIVLRGTSESVNKKVSIGSLKFFQVIDTAMKTKTQNDYTVIGTFAITPEHDLLVWDIFRERLEVPDQWPAIRNAKARYPQVIFQAIEDKQSGTGLIQTAKREGIPLLPINPYLGKKARASDNLEFNITKDKIQLSTPVSIAYQGGSVYHLSGTNWLTDFETELLQFDKGAHDDQVDVLAYAWMLAQNTGYFRPSEPLDIPNYGGGYSSEMEKITDPVMRDYVNITEEDLEEPDPLAGYKVKRPR